MNLCRADMTNIHSAKNNLMKPKKKTTESGFAHTTNLYYAANE